MIEYKPIIPKELHVVSVLGSSNWRVSEPFVYMSKRGETVSIESGFKTAFASIPFFAKPFFDRDDARIRWGALVHDYLYSTKPRWCSRKRADQILVELMDQCGLPKWQQHLFYAGVRVGGLMYWNKRS